MGKTDISLYQMSKDYKRLKELLDNGYSVLVHRGDNLLLMHRAGMSMYAEEGHYYGFSGGGFTVSPGVCETHFCEGCESLDIEFLEPDRITHDELGTLKTMAKNFLPNIHETNGGYYTVFDTLIDEEVDLLKKLSEMQL